MRTRQNGFSELGGRCITVKRNGNVFVINNVQANGLVNAYFANMKRISNARSIAGYSHSVTR